MNCTLKQSFAVILILTLMLCAVGCKKDPTLAPPENSRLDSLQICAETSHLEMAETETGYYWVFLDLLYYADKSDLHNWTVVCNQPDCNHKMDCPAKVPQTNFYIRDGRIYTAQSVIPDPDDPDSKLILGLFSRALDGTDRQLAYTLLNVWVDGVAQYNCAVDPSQYILGCTTLENDGHYQASVVRYDESGEKVLCTVNIGDTDIMAFDSNYTLDAMQGDLALYSSAMCAIDYGVEAAETDILNHLYRVTEDGYEEIPNICQYNRKGAYLKGNDFYHFISGDGYYHTDLGTGVSEKRMDAQLTDSRAYHYGTDFIVETNMVSKPVPETPELRIYNGSGWKPVTLPEALLSGEEISLYPQALASNSFFFCIYRDMGRVCDLYRVPLTGDAYAAELCATFEANW